MRASRRKKTRKSRKYGSRRKKYSLSRKRYSSRYSSKSFINRSPVQADSCFVKLIYTEDLTLSTVGGAGGYVFTGNDAFDPNYTGAGAQPLGFDEWSAFYERYRVFGSSMYVKAISNDTVDTKLCICPMISDTLRSDVRTYAADAYTRWCIVPSSNNGVRNLKKYMSSRKILEVKDIRDNVAFSALVSASPSTVWYWHIFAENSDAGDLNINAFVKIVYYIEFYRRKKLSMS